MKISNQFLSLLCAIILVSISTNVNAQFNTVNGVTSTLDKVSINTTTPYSTGIFTIQEKTNSGSAIALTSTGSNSINPNILFYHSSKKRANIRQYGANGELQFWVSNTSGGLREVMAINRYQKVSIGDVSTPGDYKLFVEKGILTEKVKVALKNTAEWADYVFADDYKLNSLETVEKFVKENKHLPNIPSAEAVVENGINVAEMDAKLLRQIEELWLHTIEASKEKEALQKQVSELMKEVEVLKNNK